MTNVNKTKLNGKSQYMYAVGSEDKERLDILNEVYNPFAKATLAKQNFKNKQEILEIACGQGDLLCWLAEQAPQAKVIGIDLSDEQLNIAKEKARQKRLKNISFIKCVIHRHGDQLNAILSAVGHNLRLILIAIALCCRCFLFAFSVKNLMIILKNIAKQISWNRFASENLVFQG